LQKILIDENLSPSLTADAQQKGFLCSHVNHLGKTGTKDWELKRVILEGDWTLLPTPSLTIGSWPSRTIACHSAGETLPWQQEKGHDRFSR